MEKDMFKKGRLVAIIVIALVLSVTTYAFAAANTVPVTAGGDGSNGIAGYSISNVAYTLDGTNTNITKVTFDAAATITPAPASPIFIAQLSTGTVTTGSTCVVGTHVVCTLTSSVAIADAATLRVIAYQ